MPCPGEIKLCFNDLHIYHKLYIHLIITASGAAIPGFIVIRAAQDCLATGKTLPLTIEFCSEWCLTNIGINNFLLASLSK